MSFGWIQSPYRKISFAPTLALEWIGISWQCLRNVTIRTVPIEKFVCRLSVSTPPVMACRITNGGRPPAVFGKASHTESQSILRVSSAPAKSKRRSLTPQERTSHERACYHPAVGSRQLDCRREFSCATPEDRLHTPSPVRCLAEEPTTDALISGLNLEKSLYVPSHCCPSHGDLLARCHRVTRRGTSAY